MAIKKLYTMQTKRNANVSLALEENTDITDTSCRPVIIFVLINNGGGITKGMLQLAPLRKTTKVQRLDPYNSV
jgi:hypothetical protein